MITQPTRPTISGLKAGDYSLPLKKMEVTGRVTGLLHSTTVRQTYRNERATPLEAIYIHPLPPKAAVHGFTLKIGERTIKGEVAERGQARRAYKEAVAKGHRAALMEEDRCDVFTTTVGNIGPGEEVQVSFELSGPLECFGQKASLRFPLVVPEVFVPGEALSGRSVGDGVEPDTDLAPDASRITPPRLPEGAENPVDLRLSFVVDPSGLDLEGVASTCHVARIKERQDGTYKVGLLPGYERLDHDFVLTLKLRENTLQSSLAVDTGSGTFALTVVPPVNSKQVETPRDLAIVLDRSGSMQGWNMVSARRAAARIVESLTPRDRFALIAFDDRIESFEDGLVPANALNQQRALAYLDKIDARGGTYATPALQTAMQYLGEDNASDRAILFLTDGDVANDAELIAGAGNGVRLHTVGIGYASRGGLLERLAQVSGGLCTLVEEESKLEDTLRTLHRNLGRPHWMGLSLHGVEVREGAPRFWDVWEEVPTTFFGRIEEVPDMVTLGGWRAEQGPYSKEIPVLKVESETISRCWARARLLDLDDQWILGKVKPQELVTLSVHAQVLCRFTAFTAIDLAEKIESEGPLHQVVQPVEPTLNRTGLSAPSISAKRVGLVAKGDSGKPSLRAEGFASKLSLGGKRPLDSFEEQGKDGASFELASEGAEYDLFCGGGFAEEVLEDALEDFPPRDQEHECLFGESLFEECAPPAPPVSRSQSVFGGPGSSGPDPSVSAPKPARIAQDLSELKVLIEQLREAKTTVEKLRLIGQMIDLVSAFLRTTGPAHAEHLRMLDILEKLSDHQEALEEGTAVPADEMALLEFLDR